MKSLGELINAKPDQIAEGELAAVAPSLVGQTHPIRAGTAGIRSAQICTCVSQRMQDGSLYLTMRRPNGTTFELRPH